jgi:hypothetical protein
MQNAKCKNQNYQSMRMEMVHPTFRYDNEVDSGNSGQGCLLFDHLPDPCIPILNNPDQVYSRLLSGKRQFMLRS